MIGDFAPKLVDLTDDVWERPELAKRDRSLITVARLVTASSFEQLANHLRLAEQNGLTETELKEAIVHLAFYAGWPKGDVRDPGCQAGPRRVAPSSCPIECRRGKLAAASFLRRAHRRAPVFAYVA
jgi:4-carboxymuconolactone decarboxylase